MKRSLVLSYVAAMTLANALMYYFVITQAHHWIYDENSLLENIQALVALIAGFAGLLQFKNNNHLLRVIGYAFAFLGLAVFLREVDVERLPYDIPALLLWLGHGFGRNIMLVILLSLVLWQAKPLFSTIRENFRPLIFSSTGLLMTGSFLLLLLSDLFEKSILGGALHVFYEEMIELDAYILFLIAALTYRYSLSSFNTHQPVEVQLPDIPVTAQEQTV